MILYANGSGSYASRDGSVRLAHTRHGNWRIEGPRGQATRSSMSSALQQLARLAPDREIEPREVQR